MLALMEISPPQSSPSLPFLHPAQPQQSLQPSKTSYHFLIVDDSAMKVFTTKLFIQEWAKDSQLDCRIVTAADGEIAITMVQESIATATPYSLIIMDYYMPGKNGFETTYAIRELFISEKPASIITQYLFPDEDNIDDSLEIGCFVRNLFRTLLKANTNLSNPETVEAPKILGHSYEFLKIAKPKDAELANFGSTLDMKKSVATPSSTPEATPSMPSRLTSGAACAATASPMASEVNFKKTNPNLCCFDAVFEILSVTQSELGEKISKSLKLS